jgi:hypothetical protein
MSWAEHWWQFTQDEAPTFNRMVNSWYLYPQGMKVSHQKNFAGMRFLKNLSSKGFVQEILLFKDQKLGISPLDP